MSCVCVCETELPAERKPAFGPAPSRHRALMLGRILLRASCQGAEMLSFPRCMEVWSLLSHFHRANAKYAPMSYSSFPAYSHVVHEGVTPLFSQKLYPNLSSTSNPSSKKSCNLSVWLSAWLSWVMASPPPVEMQPFCPFPCKRSPLSAKHQSH